MSEGAGSSLEEAAPRPDAYPPASVRIGSDECVLTAEVPGIQPEDLAVSVHRNIVHLSGTRRKETAPPGASRRRERRYGRFSRSWQLPFAVSESEVQATLENGILHLVLPRAKDDKPKKIDIRHVT
jgi:HSP20 family protein